MHDSIKSWMLNASSLAFRAAALVNVRPFAKAFLRHTFLFNEPKSRSIDRLRRELEFMRRSHTPVNLPEFVSSFCAGDILDGALVFTTDDVHLDVYEVHQEFLDFGVPLAMYIPIGWISSSDTSEAGALVEAVTLIEWYEGEEVVVNFGSRHSLHLSSERKALNIDYILSGREALAEQLDDLCSVIAALPGSHRQRHKQRSTCSWAELHELASSGVYIGSHSISHVPLAKASTQRRQFEICESKRILELKFGSCTTFAYPFGTRGTYDTNTDAELSDAGYSVAFLTHSDVICSDSPALRLPRISLPDAPLALEEFKARVSGAGILPQRFKSALGGR
ncbi:MAG: polysaccharide deacetylase family protein [Novosphingobium sp.]|nr:polysaccharide deacetylase family protein [Novosphingobium sp.]